MTSMGISFRLEQMFEDCLRSGDPILEISLFPRLLTEDLASEWQMTETNCLRSDDERNESDPFSLPPQNL